MTEVQSEGVAYCLNFCQIQPGVADKSDAYKKSVCWAKIVKKWEPAEAATAGVL